MHIKNKWSHSKSTRNIHKNWLVLFEVMIFELQTVCRLQTVRIDNIIINSQQHCCACNFEYCNKKIQNYEIDVVCKCIFFFLFDVCLVSGIVVSSPFWINSLKPKVCVVVVVVAFLISIQAIHFAILLINIHVSIVCVYVCVRARRFVRDRGRMFFECSIDFSHRLRLIFAFANKTKTRNREPNALNLDQTLPLFICRAKRK